MAEMELATETVVEAVLANVVAPEVTEEMEDSGPQDQQPPVLNGDHIMPPMEEETAAPDVGAECVQPENGGGEKESQRPEDKKHETEVATEDAEVSPQGNGELPAQMEPKASTPEQMPPPPSTAMGYSELFPALPSASVPKPPGGAWGRPLPKVKSSTVTEVIQVSADGLGDNKQQRLKRIAEQTGAKIEMSQNKARGVTFAISGKQGQVAKAKQLLQSKFMPQKVMEVSMSANQYTALLGQEGGRIKAIEDNYGVRIMAPRRDGTGAGTVTIAGTQEGVQKAALELQAASEQAARRTRDVVTVERSMHPFVFGANEAEVPKLEAQAGPSVKIHVPPATVGNDDVVIVGLKEEVAAAVRLIHERVATKQTALKTAKVEIRKQQHKWLREARVVDEILMATGAVVDVPLPDSPSETIVVRGEGDSLLNALKMVMEKAASMDTVEVMCPAWLHKHVLGKHSTGLTALREGTSHLLRISFQDNTDSIVVEGPTADVATVVARLRPMVDDLKANKTRVEMKVPTELHRAIAGKGGAGIRKLKDTLGVDVYLAAEGEKSDHVAIEGPAAAAAQTKADFEAMVATHKDTQTAEVTIPQKFHGQVIGARGEELQKLQAQFPSVRIDFPNNGDKVTVKGLSKDVKGCVSLLKKITAELIENSYTLNVIVYRQFHGSVIGRGGANIRRIRDATNTKISVPEESENRDTITVVGRKENCLKAQEMLLAIQTELVKTIEAEVNINQSLHSYLIGPKGVTIRGICEECNNVNVEFPKEGSASPDVITVRGPAEDVESAKKLLLKMAEEKALVSHVETVECDPEMHGYLIGKDQATKRRIQEETDTRLVFPGRGEECKEVSIVGRKENALKAKAMLQDLIDAYVVRVSEEIPVTELPLRMQQYRFDMAREMQDQGVNMVFLREKNMFVLRGPPDDVAAAKSKLEKCLEEMAQDVTIDVPIGREHYGTLMGRKGVRVNAIQSKHQVHIRFPDNNGTPAEGKEVEEDCDVRITGQPENVEAAKEEMMGYLPTTVTMDVDNKFHGPLFGRGAWRDRNSTKQVVTPARHLKQTFGVTLDVEDKEGNTIVLTGPLNAMYDAQAYVREKLGDIARELEDQALRNFSMTVEIDADMVPRIIGRGGQTITNIRNKTGCRIHVPKDTEEDPVPMIITGYEESCKKAIAMMEAIVGPLGNGEDMVEREIEVDHRVHGRMIGSGGRNINNLSRELGVHIKFPREKDSDVVLLKGPADKMDEAEDHILDLVEQYLLIIE